ncbi:unnamed protein product [Prunus armeniaca]|uniref:Uncharacterized protein n=1 Tax=Prunus armeniaca TaxID=36596 RepID=A0A6J5UC77_PRUAR|nr:unnamed protein product [Prunus armeniaca]
MSAPSIPVPPPPGSQFAPMQAYIPLPVPPPAIQMMPPPPPPPPPPPQRAPSPLPEELAPKRQEA